MQPGRTEVWHQLRIAEAAKALRTDVSSGLSATDAASRLAEHGPNELAETPPPPWWRKLLAQFGDLVIWILLAATALSAVLRDWLEAAAIFAIVLLNALLGFFQEQKAERALRSLKKLSAQTAKIIRSGSRQIVPAEALVPGDLVELEAGDHVPADLRLTKAHSFKVQEAALTGESFPVEKNAMSTVEADAAIAERPNMAYVGTTAVTGKAAGLVVATGMDTELGHIAGLLQAEQREPTPLQKRLGQLGRVLIFACLSLVALIFALQLFRGENLGQTFLMAISLAVAAVPEGLPAVVTVALALGLQRMVRRNALIRRLSSVETLGCVTVICSDKTGTLTRNEMTVTDIATTTEHVQVTGVGYKPDGEFRRLTSGGAGGNTIVSLRNGSEIRLALSIGRWCNNARLECSSTGNWEVFGDPTEAALLVAARKAGLRDGEVSIVHEIPFDSDRKLMSMIVKSADDRTLLYTKGAPELVLSRCDFEYRGGEKEPLTFNRREQIRQQSEELAKRGLRVLAAAYRNLGVDADKYEERELVFVGLIGMIDPPREEARIAVAKCRSAGIRPVVITGDHPATALSIARELNIANEKDVALTGPELDAFSDRQLGAKIDSVPVYARVSPEHKLRIVTALKEKGHVVAMTGDGVNDAPAVKMADIGIAMGITGTDVTKDASDMVLMDDNFASIVNAVEEGRGIYDNIQQFVHYLLSCNTGEIALVLFAALAGWPIPLIPIQILWMNLVTDGFPALALAMEMPEPNVMQRPPRSPNEVFFDRSRGWQIIIHGSLMAAVMIVGFGYAHFTRSAADARAMTFFIATFAQLFFSFACRSPRHTVPRLGIFTNPYLLGAIGVSALLQLALLWLPVTRRLFFTESSEFGLDWIVIFALALVPVSAVEIGKLITNRGAFRAAYQ